MTVVQDQPLYLLKVTHVSVFTQLYLPHDMLQFHMINVPVNTMGALYKDFEIYPCMGKHKVAVRNKSTNFLKQILTLQNHRKMQMCHSISCRLKIGTYKGVRYS